MLPLCVQACVTTGKNGSGTVHSSHSCFPFPHHARHFYSKYSPGCTWQKPWLEASVEVNTHCCLWKRTSWGMVLRQERTTTKTRTPHKKGEALRASDGETRRLNVWLRCAALLQGRCVCERTNRKVMERIKGGPAG